VWRAVYKKVGTRDNPAGELDDKEFLLWSNDCFKTKRAPKPSGHQFLRSFDGAFTHLICIGKQRFAKRQWAVADNHKRGFDTQSLLVMTWNSSQGINICFVAPVN